MATEIILGFIDYENFRMAFPKYSEYLSVEDIIKALEDLGANSASYGPFSSMVTGCSVDPKIAERSNIAAPRHKRAIDPFSAVIAATFPWASTCTITLETIRMFRSFILYGLDGRGFKEAILRCKQHGKRIYVL